MQERFCKCFLHASITNVVKGIMAGVRLAAGELASLTDLLHEDIHARVDSHHCNSEEDERSVLHDDDQRVYLVIFYKKKDVQSSCSIEQMCGCMLTDFNLEITYAIFHPTNQAARNVCEDFKQLLIEDILRYLHSLLITPPKG